MYHKKENTKVLNIDSENNGQNYIEWKKIPKFDKTEY